MQPAPGQDPQPAEPEPQPAQAGNHDALICWVCQFVDCEEHPEEPLLDTGCACCRPGSSGGRAHVSCLAGAAAHQQKLWHQCPTCKQEFSGAVHIGLSRARWELLRNRPEADQERLTALRQLATAADCSGDHATAQPMWEELVAVGRRTFGDVHLFTLQAIGALGNALVFTDRATAQPLLEEAIAGLRSSSSLSSFHSGAASSPCTIMAEPGTKMRLGGLLSMGLPAQKLASWRTWYCPFPVSKPTTSTSSVPPFRCPKARVSDGNSASTCRVPANLATSDCVHGCAGPSSRRAVAATSSRSASATIQSPMLWRD